MFIYVVFGGGSHYARERSCYIWHTTEKLTMFACLWNRFNGNLVKSLLKAGADEYLHPTENYGRSLSIVFLKKIPPNIPLKTVKCSVVSIWRWYLRIVAEKSWKVTNISWKGNLFKKSSIWLSRASFGCFVSNFEKCNHVTSGVGCYPIAMIIVEISSTIAQIP